MVQFGGLILVSWVIQPSNPGGLNTERGPNNPYLLQLVEPENTSSRPDNRQIQLLYCILMLEKCNKKFFLNNPFDMLGIIRVADEPSV